MRQSPQIAVLMAAFNAERHIEEAILSILKQSYPEFLLIISDDASTDNTLKIARHYAELDPRILVLHNSQNLKFSGNRNRLLQAVPQEIPYIAILDSDDIASPERLMRQHQFLEQHPEIDGVGTALTIVNDHSEVIASRFYPEKSDELLAQALDSNPVANSSLMLRHRLVQEIGTYDTHLSCCEDYDYLLRILCKHSVANLGLPLVSYRVSENQFSANNVKKMLADTLKIQRRFLFHPRFFSLYHLAVHLLKYLLFLLPSQWISRLHKKMTTHDSSFLA